MSEKKVFYNSLEEAIKEGYSLVYVDLEDKEHCRTYLIEAKERFVKYGNKNGAVNFEYGNLNEDGIFIKNYNCSISILDILKKHPDLIKEAVAFVDYHVERKRIIKYDTKRPIGLDAAYDIASFDKQYLPKFYNYLFKGDLDHDLGWYGPAIFSKVDELLAEGDEEEAFKLLAARYGRLMGVDTETDYQFQQEYFDALSPDQMRKFLQYFLLEKNISRNADLSILMVAMGYDVHYDDEDEMPLPQELWEERAEIINKIAIEKRDDPNKETNDKIRNENLAMLPYLSQILDPTFKMPAFKPFIK